MTEPQLPVTPPASRAPVILRIILAVILILFIAIGMLVLAVTTADWISNGFDYAGWDKTWAPLYILPAACLVLFSAAMLGIVLRYARWPNATTGSLVLSILSTCTIVLSARLMMSAFNEGEVEEGWWSVMIASLLALAAISVPPFLHWWRGSRR